MDGDRPELQRVREICLALPEVSERLSHGSPAWFIRGKETLAMYLDDHHGDGRLAVICVAPPGVQEELVTKAPELYDITIFGAEPRVNYDRIMLSPVLSGEKEYKEIVIHDDAWYEKHGVTLLKGRLVMPAGSSPVPIVIEVHGSEKDSAILYEWRQRMFPAQGVGLIRSTTCDDCFSIYPQITSSENP